MSVERKLRLALERAVELGERGVQIAAYVNGERVLSGAIGSMNDAGTPVTEDTLFPIFSVTKGLAATAVHIQAERGLLAYSEPVAKYWPEFGVHGKDSITVQDVLVHQAGLPQMPAGTSPEKLAHWDWCVRGLADLEPLFPRGKSAYASISYGWLLGEVVRRTDTAGRSFSDFIQQEIFDSLGIEDYHLGMGGRNHERVAQLYTAGGLRPQPSQYRSLAMPESITPGPIWNDPVFYDAVVPGAGGIANADSVAKFFGLLANKGKSNGNRLLSQARVMSFTEPRSNSNEHDEVLGQTPWVGVGGYWLGGPTPPAEPIIGTNPNVLASNGSGGSIGWADPDIGLSAAICHNRMFRINPPLPPEEHPFTDLGDLVRSLVS
ncbi:serine hydrolase domain-containing protein [Rhodococcus globerulus]|uniref:Serine hydrolase domain-containing protein n=1 Tax=Rhodococcus globerulus TaxID=33008 RepID=A0ABU4C4M5_RHOGO|nr:serine hydrolase domain-containing protein [Rhodococcus globerulus]MDV6271446.1 serine hydrolase domain-containing protein [Rhodococcus globerulus]